MKNLTTRGVDAAKPRGKRYALRDAKVPGLELRVSPAGARSWALRYRIHGRRRRMTLGQYPGLGLAAARDKALEALHDVHNDRDPAIAQRERREAATFQELADRYIEKYAKRRKKSWKEDRRKLEKEIPRPWRKRLAKEITRRDVREIIDAKAEDAPIAANRLRALLHTVFEYALEHPTFMETHEEGVQIVREIVPDDHANPVSKVPRPGVERQRDRVLTEDEIRTFWESSGPGEGDDEMSTPMSAFWRLRLVTAQRAVEVNTMRWDDLDFDNAVWTIPADQSKNGLAHRVPLSALALEVILSLNRFDEYVTAGARGNRQRSEAARLIDIDGFRGHDLRRTGASYMASAGIPRLHIAKVLNHAERGVTAVYDRHSYDAEKRVALDTWGARLGAILKRADGAKVVPFAR